MSATTTTAATTLPTIIITPNFNGADVATVVGYVDGVSVDYAVEVVTALVGDHQEAVQLVAAAERAAWAAAR